MEKTTLSVKDLKKTIGKKEIIKGISIELKEGEVFGFLGQMELERRQRSGCLSG